MKKYLVIIFLLYFIASCSKKRITVEQKNNVVNIKKNNIDTLDNRLVEMFERTMKSTSFTALIRYYKVETVAIMDEDDNDDFSEKKLIFYADVIEIFKGEAKKKISYEMIVEKNEEVGFDKEIKMVCLCENNNVLFWPGTGSSFPNENFIIKRAKEIKKIFSSRDNKENICLD